jgi:hypothetical protein
VSSVSLRCGPSGREFFALQPPTNGGGVVVTIPACLKTVPCWRPESAKLRPHDRFGRVRRLEFRVYAGQTVRMALEILRLRDTEPAAPEDSHTRLKAELPTGASAAWGRRGSIFGQDHVSPGGIRVYRSYNRMYFVVDNDEWL